MVQYRQVLPSDRRPSNNKRATEISCPPLVILCTLFPRFVAVSQNELSCWAQASTKRTLSSQRVSLLPEQGFPRITTECYFYFLYSPTFCSVVQQIFMRPSKASLHREGKSLLMLFILLVAQLYAGGDWQASGSFRPGQYGAVRAAIDQAFDGGLTGQTFACNISTALNNQFGRFWNVAAGKVRDLQFDAVLFGFAHEGHWFWINSYRDNKFVIVWKDYNCQEQFSRSWGDTREDFFRSESNIYDVNQGSRVFNGALPTKDIWAGLYNFVQDLQDDEYSPNTISGVAAFSGFAKLAVCYCGLAEADYSYERYGLNDGTVVRYFAFQTRAGKTPLTPLPS